MRLENFKSPCKACAHLHSHESLCSYLMENSGNLYLAPTNSYDFGNVWSGEKSFIYRQTKPCNCLYYVPSNNLEYMEWLYEQSNQSIR